MTNLWRGLALLWLGGVASPLLVVDAAADGLGIDDPRHRPPVIERSADPDAGGRLTLVAPTELVDRALRDPQGEAAGVLRNLVVDARTGAIAFALVGTSNGLDLGDAVVAVPWSAMRAPDETRQKLAVAVPAQRIAAAPRLARGEAAERLAPEAAAQALAWFGAPPAGAGAAPVLVPVNRMLGALVYSADDSETIGGVSQIMLDLRHGHVAYCVVSRDGGGFRAWIPVPFSALAWAADLGDFTFRRDAAALDHAPTLPVEPTSTTTSEADLGALYGRFGVAAYWTRRS
jgi:sporulation protein YlmC with PRC-barrel domain